MRFYLGGLWHSLYFLFGGVDMTDDQIKQLAERALIGFPMHPIQTQLPILKQILAQVEDVLRFVRDTSGATEK